MKWLITSLFFGWFPKFNTITFWIHSPTKTTILAIINSIIDQKIHTAGMTEKEAMDLMMNEGYQEEGEAAGKWRRACLSSTQLSTYYVGNIEINGIRSAYETKTGKKVDMKAMHDAMLSFGSPAPKYVKELLEK